MDVTERGLFVHQLSDCWCFEHRRICMCQGTCASSMACVITINCTHLPRKAWTTYERDVAWPLPSKAHPTVACHRYISCRMPRASQTAGIHILATLVRLLLFRCHRKDGNRHKQHSTYVDPSTLATELYNATSHCIYAPRKNTSSIVQSHL